MPISSQKSSISSGGISLRYRITVNPMVFAWTIISLLGEVCAPTSHIFFPFRWKYPSHTRKSLNPKRLEYCAVPQMLETRRFMVYSTGESGDQYSKLFTVISVLTSFRDSAGTVKSMFFSHIAPLRSITDAVILTSASFFSRFCSVNTVCTEPVFASGRIYLSVNSTQGFFSSVT